MKYLNILLTIVAALVSVSCSVEGVNAPEAVEQTSGKIANTSIRAVKGTLIAKFDEEYIPIIEEACLGYELTRSGVVISGVESLDSLFREIHVTAFGRVFPKDERFEENTVKSGLNRWYIINFDENTDLDEAARKLAELAEVTTVQFSGEKKKTFTSEVYPFEESAAGPVKAMVTSDFNDPNLFWQWNYINNADQAISNTSLAGMDINAAPAWKITGGDSRVIVAVVDEGVKYTHPDLAANMWTNPEPSAEYDYQDIHGWNFADNGPISWDKKGTNSFGEETSDSGHGTHVAGTVAAVSNNGIGVAGVAGGTGSGDGVRIMSCQVFSAGGSSNDASVSRAIKYAADHGAAILQCSYGNQNTSVQSDRDYAAVSPLEREALEYFMSPVYNRSEVIDGGIAIFAAGNEGMTRSNYPGGYRDCISVTAIAPDGLPATYTCYGPGCNIVAPGGETSGHVGGERAGVLSTVVSEISGSDYGYMQGTSMACPHVSGVAALGLSYALQKGITISRDDFISMLLTSVNEIDSRFEGTKTAAKTINLEDYIGKMGTGLIDAYQLLMQIEGTPCLKIGTDKLELVTLTQYFGGSAGNLTYTSVEVSDEDMQKLQMPAEPQMYNGQLMIRCNAPGVAHITVRAVAGGSRPGSETVPGGIEVSKTFAVIARESNASNGGWL